MLYFLANFLQPSLRIKNDHKSFTILSNRSYVDKTLVKLINNEKLDKNEIVESR